MLDAQKKHTATDWDPDAMHPYMGLQTALLQQRLKLLQLPIRTGVIVL